MIVPVALRVIGIPLLKIKKVHYQPYRPESKTFLLIANHNETLDPAYEMVSLMRYVRYVSSDHVVRSGFAGWFFNFFGTLLIKHRDRPVEELIQNIKDTIAAGVSVGIHVEGGMSFNGESRYISPNTAKLVKEIGCPVITFRGVGGYLRAPRWGKHHRKGPLYAGVVREYTKEEINAMTVEEIHKAICRDLHVNAYEEQRKTGSIYQGEALAESCEIILYQCPVCRQVGTLHSKGEELACDCGYRVRMGEDGFFHDCGKGMRFDNVCEWERWQREAIKEYIDSFQDRKEQPVFQDEGQILKKIVDGKEILLSEKAVLALFYDRVELSWEGERWSAELTEVQKMDYVKWQSLLLVTGQDYFDIGSTVSRSATKYMDAWRHLTGRANY